MPNIYKFCRYCGRELPQGRELNFCPHCGKRLAAPHAETVTPPVVAPISQEIKPNRETVTHEPVPINVPASAFVPEKTKPVEETVTEVLEETGEKAPSKPIESPVEMPQPVPPALPKTDELKTVEENKEEIPTIPAPEVKPRKGGKNKAEKPKKRGKVGVSILAAVLILTVLCAATYFLTPLGATIQDLKTLHDIDSYFAVGDVNSAVDGVSRLNAPEKYTERINPVVYYTAALENKDNEDYDKALDYFALCPDYSDVKEQTAECYYRLGKRSEETKEYDKALEYFALCTDYSDSEEQIRACNYCLGVTAFVNKSYVAAVEYFTNAGDYNTSPQMLEQSRELLIKDENYSQKVDFESVYNWDDRLDDYYIEGFHAAFADSIRAVKEENEIIILVDWNWHYDNYKVFSEIDGEMVVYLDGRAPDKEILVAKIPFSDIIENEAQISIGIEYYAIYGNRPRYIINLDKEQLINIANG